MEDKTLQWGIFLDHNGVPHVIPMYDLKTVQPGHVVSHNCNCFVEIRKYPTQVIVMHKIIQ